jgi:hypothetical protein
MAIHALSPFTALHREALAVMGNLSGAHVPSASYGFKQANPRTNLRLTGAPLTAEDLKRIAECEVACEILERNPSPPAIRPECCFCGGQFHEPEECPENGY